MTLEMQYFYDNTFSNTFVTSGRRSIKESGTKQDVFPRVHSTAGSEETPKSSRFFDHVAL